MVKSSAVFPCSRKIWHSGALLCILLAGSLLSVGCAHHKRTTTETVFERGWIGGEYRPAHIRHQMFSPRDTLNAFPSGLVPSYKAGLLLSSLSTNTPAQIGGLREGDLIVAIDEQPVSTLEDFRHAIDHSSPGAKLEIRVFRKGKLLDCSVLAGREKFKRQGELMIALPLITRELDLWPNPGVSLIVLGYAPNPGHRVELASAESQYLKSCEPKGYQAIDENWRAWLVIFQLSRREIILSQDRVEAPNKNFRRNPTDLERAEAETTTLTAKR